MARRKKDEPPPPPPVRITAAGDTPAQAGANLAQSQRAPGYVETVMLLADSIFKQVDTVMLDYTRDAVGMRYQIDGVWHNLPSRDRQSGDAMLAVMKKLANLNHAERRARQRGTFKAQFNESRCSCTLTSQGVQTGERVILELKGYNRKLETLIDLGMREKMRDKFKELIDSPPGFVVVSAMPKDGLTTTWCAMLTAADRFMRDFVSLEDEANPQPEVINVEQVFFKRAEGQTPTSILPKVLLKQPEVIVVPEVGEGDIVTALTNEVLEEKRQAIVSVRAREAVEALLRIVALEPNVAKFAKAVTLVLNHRLVRRLCQNCRQPYQPNPQLLQKLGIPQGRIQFLYKHYEPPPAGQVDAKGQPIQPQICPKCNGLGYRGRAAIFEMLIINDQIREALTKNANLESLRQVARQSRHHSLQEEGILTVAQGITSLAELQRVLKQ